MPPPSPHPTPQVQLLKTTSAAGTVQIWAGRASGRNTIAVTERFELRDSTWISDDDPSVWVPPEYRQHTKSLPQHGGSATLVSSRLHAGALIGGGMAGFVLVAAVGFGLVYRWPAAQKGGDGSRVQLRRATAKQSAAGTVAEFGGSAACGGESAHGSERLKASQLSEVVVQTMTAPAADCCRDFDGATHLRGGGKQAVTSNGLLTY